LDLQNEDLATSLPRFDIKGVQPVLNAAKFSGCREKQPAAVNSMLRSHTIL